MFEGVDGRREKSASLLMSNGGKDENLSPNGEAVSIRLIIMMNKNMPSFYCAHHAPARSISARDV